MRWQDRRQLGTARLGWRGEARRDRHALGVALLAGFDRLAAQAGRVAVGQGEQIAQLGRAILTRGVDGAGMQRCPKDEDCGGKLENRRRLCTRKRS
ncbi:MAG: hypothetical protein HY902_18475 [Deltaproteobacteria bacterium]|nr:hypothetical protein [Deltaproteobacteria bacterium]